ncbi:MAG: helix-turn-helix domain-containing protein [Lachnospiraceae bacterium]|nr:helix-turn-helix domain-containing protein [Lachnospiraceae bacterium]
MDQIKIGKFIANCRKEKNMTQRQLADILGISDKTISKWECGKGLPEVQFMIPLCDLLGINVNELLSGEKLSADEYPKKAEENIMTLVKENEYVKTYKPLAWWFVSFVVFALFFGFGWKSLGNAKILSKIVIILAMALVDVLFSIIFKGEYVYWIVYGPDFETAKNSDSHRRKTYAWKYLRIFLVASIILMIFLFGSMLFDLSASFDFIVFGVIVISAALTTVSIKF